MKSLLFWNVMWRVGGYLWTFWDKLPVPSSRVKIGLIGYSETLMITHLWHIASLKSKYLTYTAL